MKFFFLSIIILICNFSLSQEEKTETIITTIDSVQFYTHKYKDLSKAIKVVPCKSMRVSYVYLDGSKLTLDKINDLRESIIVDYKKGKPFAELANRYTMDISKDGDLGWFDEGMMVKVFEDEVKKHQKGDIFTIDIPDRNWYYVVLKTFDEIKKARMEIELD
jgi:hypothetical protein